MHRSFPNDFSPLEAQEGRLFKPLAYPRQFQWLRAALALSVTPGSALMIVFGSAAASFRTAKIR